MLKVGFGMVIGVVLSIAAIVAFFMSMPVPFGN